MIRVFRKSPVSLGRMMTVSSNEHSFMYEHEILQVAMDCIGEPTNIPEMPERCMGCRDCGNLKEFATRSVMNEEEDLVSRIALTYAERRLHLETSLQFCRSSARTWV